MIENIQIYLLVIFDSKINPKKINQRIKKVKNLKKIKIWTMTLIVKILMRVVRKMIIEREVFFSLFFNKFYKFKLNYNKWLRVIFNINKSWKKTQIIFWYFSIDRSKLNEKNQKIYLCNLFYSKIKILIKVNFQIWTFLVRKIKLSFLRSLLILEVRKRFLYSLKLVRNLSNLFWKKFNKRIIENNLSFYRKKKKIIFWKS